MLLTQWFDPEPTPKGLEFAQELARQGFAVEVVTGFPNYPGGKLYPGYRMRPIQRERSGDVRITRLPLFPSHSQSALGRVLNYVSFAAALLVYGLFAKRADVVYAYHPPLTVGIVAAIVRLVRRVPVVYDVQDMWPDTLRATGMIGNARALRVIERVCRWVYRHVDHVVVLSPGFKTLLMARGVEERKIDVIYNWCNETAMAIGDAPTTPAERSGDRDRFEILFAGNMGKAQALDAVLEAAKLLVHSAPQVEFKFLGRGVEVERLARLARDGGLVNVSFLPQVSMERAAALLRGADALLVHLKKDPLFEITIPSKTQAYLATGRPVLMAVGGDAATLIAQSGGGIVVESESPASIAAGVTALLTAGREARERMGRAGAEFYREHLSMRVGVGKFAAIFNRLAATGHRI